MNLTKQFQSWTILESKKNDSQKKAAKISTIPISIRPLIEKEPIYTTRWESPPRGDTI